MLFACCICFCFFSRVVFCQFLDTSSFASSIPYFSPVDHTWFSLLLGDGFQKRAGEAATGRAFCKNLEESETNSRFPKCALMVLCPSMAFSLQWLNH